MGKPFGQADYQQSPSTKPIKKAYWLNPSTNPLAERIGKANSQSQIKPIGKAHWQERVYFDKVNFLP